MSRPTDLDIDEAINVLATTDWRAYGRRMKAAVARDRRGGSTRHDGFPAGGGGPGPTNSVSRPTESAVMAGYQTAREDPTARVCPNDCSARVERITVEDIEEGAPLEPGFYCSACGSLTQPVDGPPGAGRFVTVLDPLHGLVERAWAHLQKIGVSHEAFDDLLDAADALGDDVAEPAVCEPCERAGRRAPVHAVSTVGGRLPRDEHLCLWHHKWIWRHNDPIVPDGPEPEYPSTEKVHAYHAQRTTPLAASTKAKPASARPALART